MIRRFSNKNPLIKTGNGYSVYYSGIYDNGINDYFILPTEIRSIENPSFMIRLGKYGIDFMQSLDGVRTYRLIVSVSGIGSPVNLWFSKNVDYTTEGRGRVNDVRSINLDYVNGVYILDAFLYVKDADIVIFILASSPNIIDNVEGEMNIWGM